MFSLLWIRGLVGRRTARIAGLVFCVGLAVALFASLGMFFAASKAKMTREAAAGVPVDWQVQLASGTNAGFAQRTVGRAPGVTRTEQVGYGDVTYFRSTAGGTTQTTGSGKALGIDAGYSRAFPGEIRFLLGARSGILIAQQTAANLQAGVGTIVEVGRPGLPPARVKVAGIVDLPSADSMFQTVGAPPGTGPTAPPDNVILLPSGLWHRLYDPVLAGNPSAAHLQIHADLSSVLPADPAAAFSSLVSRERNLEARLAGTGVVGDNLAAQLDAGRQDAVYAELLFLFLGLPGIVLAALLAVVAGDAGRDRRRSEQALLRLRGASLRQIMRLTGIEAALVGVLGVALGLAGAALAGAFAFGTSRFGATPLQAEAWLGFSVILGFGLSSATILLPAWRDARDMTIQRARSLDAGGRPPLWSRVYLDLVLLAGAGLIFWQSMRDAYQVVLAPEGVPTISVNYITLLAPLMFWLGAALATWRLSRLLLSTGRPLVAKIMKPLAGRLSGVVAASMSRQSTLLTRGLVIVALTASFALSVAIFNTTYMNQARVDAELTNGADVTVSSTAAAGLPARLAESVRKLPGVAAAQPMRHRFAYVGNDLQDLYGIDPGKIETATHVSDAFFAGGTSRQILSRLTARPDGVLVSAETVNDFQLAPGDLIRVRLQSPRDHAYHAIRFHYVGIVREFPTAPRDSFLVANASYVARATGSPVSETLLVRTSGPPPAVAADVRHLLGRASGATVQDVVSQLKITLSGLTAMDLSGLTRLELAFAAILAGASTGLVLLLGFAERRRTFAIASALGAHARQLASFVWSESLFVTVGGVLLGGLTGWLLSYVIVDILTGVFDPPPDRLFVPWAYLLLLFVIVTAAVAAAGVTAIRASRKPALEIIRDL